MKQPTSRTTLSALTALSLAVSAMVAACGGGDAGPPPLMVAPPAPAPSPAPPPPPAPPPAPSPSGTVLVSFDEATPAITGVGAYGGALPSVEAGPTGGSAMALKILKPVSPDTFGGTYFTVAAIPFATNRKVITARVNSSRPGAVIKFKVEIAGGANVEIASAPTGAANTWSTVTWDFSAVDVTKAYTVVAITPDADLVTSGQTYWIDDITLAPASASPPPAPPPAPSGTVLASFDEVTPLPFVGFNGAEGTTVETGPAGGSGKALKILRLGGDVFAGAFVTTGAIPFAANRSTITARVYSPIAGIPIKLKVEDASGAASAEIAATPAVVVGWQTLTWVVSGLDLTKTYTRVVLLPRLGTVDPAPGVSYYFDDITLAPAGAVVPPLTSLTFDEATPAYSNLGAFAGAQPSVEAGPAGGSGMALKIVKAASPDTFGGIFFDTAPIGFTNTNRAVTARVNSSVAGAVISLKVQVTQADFVEVLGTPTGAANTWTTVTWDFSAVSLAKSYTTVAIIPQNGTVASGQVYWIDDIAVVAGGAPAPAPAPLPSPVTIATLDEPGASLTGFEGCYDSTLVADPTGGTNKVGKVIKPGSGVPFYCGSTVVTVANGGFQAIPFTNSATTLTVRVYSPDVGIPVRLKVEDIADGTKSVETEVMTTAVGWQTLSFNFANAAASTPVLNLSTTYKKATIFFDFGTLGSGKTYYFDDITFVTGTGTNIALVTFDERSFDNTQSQPSVLSGFGGAENSTLVGAADVGVPPDGAKTGKWAKVVKNAAFTYAGTSVQRKPNDAVPTIPFATGATKMSVRVYSAYPGMRVHLKVEQSGRPDFNSEVDAFTSLTNTWETLTFDFGPLGKHFVPSGPGPNGYVTDPNSPAYRPTSQLDVSKTFNKVNIFFDYGLGDAGYDPMPSTRTYYFDDVKFIGP